ncbi:MAG: hydantoinase/oxoprolinase family protein, partial [Alphaproteobacteria bacterium]|nr:hydantoinase/oxoprolinase family protein [Alphaproteobacteria bacterium]
IAAVNRVGLVQVGPESASADPGPVCYGGGGVEPTVTDADLILGYLDPDNFAGGSIRLDMDSAAAQLERKIAQPQDRDLIAAAWTVHDVINETMAAAVRMHVTERGGNPQAATMVAFGGAGPVHAYNLARKLRMSSIIVPLRAGVLSAEGLLMAPPAYDIVRTHKVPLADFDPAGTDAAMDTMAEEIGRQLDGVGTAGDRQFTRSVDVGYIGQSYQVTVPLEPGMDRDAIFARFAQLYREKYGYFYDDVPAEVVSVRVLGEILGGGLELEPLAAADDEKPPAGTQRQAYSPRQEAMVAFTVFDRAALRPGMRFPGPAIVEEPTATTIIDADGHVEVDRFGSLVISLGDQTP